MGTWGSSLYANDTTCDVRDTYLSFLTEQCSDQEAYEKTLEALEAYLNDDEAPLVWYALAETQWKIGRLVPEVKAKALYWLDREGGLEPWRETSSKGNGWKKTMMQLREKLEKPMPKRKNIQKPELINNDPWNLYDIYAYQLHDERYSKSELLGKYIVLQKIGAQDIGSYGGLMMRVQVFDGVFEELPTLEQLGNLRILPFDLPQRTYFDRDPIWMSALLFSWKKADYPRKHLTFLGNQEIKKNVMLNKREHAWSRIEDIFQCYFDLWKDVEYEILGNGLYRYPMGNR